MNFLHSSKILQWLKKVFGVDPQPNDCLLSHTLEKLMSDRLRHTQDVHRERERPTCSQKLKYAISTGDFISELFLIISVLLGWCHDSCHRNDVYGAPLKLSCAAERVRGNSVCSVNSPQNNRIRVTQWPGKKRDSAIGRKPRAVDVQRSMKQLRKAKIKLKTKNEK